MTDLAPRLGDLVRSVPGVTALYPAAPAVVAMTDAAIATVAPDRPIRDPIAVTEAIDGVTVSAVIGITDDEAATDVCRRVYDTIAGHLAAVGSPIAAIEVRVGSID